MSDDTLLTAVLAVQKAAPKLPKDKTNPHYNSKFTGLDTIAEKIDPLLTEHGLVWMTFPGRDDHGDPCLAYRLTHVCTGEVLNGTMPLLLGKGDMQALGSAITYARRYSKLAVLDLVGDEDDDGNAAGVGQSSGNFRRSGATPSGPQKKLIQQLINEKGVTKSILSALIAELGHDFPIEEGWMDRLTPGKEGTASALIDRLSRGAPWPDPENASDVPGGEFQHAEAGAGELFTEARS